jgi:hypothetical protein
MSPYVSRGRGRAPAHVVAPSVVKLTTNEVIGTLRAEGFRVTRRIINHACDLGVVQRPPRAGNLRRWTAFHLEALRYYLREHSRTQPAGIAGEVGR